MNKNIKIKIKNLSFYYWDRLVLKEISIEIIENTITAITGPSGQGKSTFLMTLNRLWENIEGAGFKGRIEIKFNSDFQNIYDKKYPVPELRRQVGMVFQVPNPLPMSVYNNVAFPLKLKGEKKKESIFPKVKNALKKAFLWQEVKERLNKDARSLSGGQQQRLCIARALILNPTVLLLDEPTSSLDEKSGRVIEDLLLQLKKTCTIILVSHYMDQVKRVADIELLLSDGKLQMDTYSSFNHNV
jgi:phosphate transport system ATP-binding protein